MATRITRDDFEARFAALRPSLTTFARTLLSRPDDVKDCVNDTYCHAAYALESYDDGNADGNGRFVNWVYRICRHAAIDRQRQLSRETSLNALMEREEESDEEETAATAARWATLYEQDNRAWLNDTELRHEAIMRLRFADLSREESICLGGRLHHKKLRQIARELAALTGDREVSQATVCRIIQGAVEKLRAVPMEAIGAPDVDRYQWRKGSQVTCYDAPTTVGSALAREKVQKWDSIAFRKVA